MQTVHGHMVRENDVLMILDSTDFPKTKRTWELIENWTLCYEPDEKVRRLLEGTRLVEPVDVRKIGAAKSSGHSGQTLWVHRQVLKPKILCEGVDVNRYAREVYVQVGSILVEHLEGHLACDYLKAFRKFRALAAAVSLMSSKL